MTKKKSSHMQNRCNVCKLPDDVQELVYELLVRQKVKPGPAYIEISQALKDRGLNPPNRSGFYTHIKNHLDPEKMALMTISRGENQLGENVRGFDSLLFSYLLKKWEEEKGNRQSLQNLIKKIDTQVDTGKLNAGDLAKLGSALSCAIRTLQEGSLMSMVQDKVIDDLLLGVTFTIEKEVAIKLRQTRDTLLLKVKPGDEAKRIIDEALSSIVKSCEETYQLASQSVLQSLRSYKL